MTRTPRLALSTALGLALTLACVARGQQPAGTGNSFAPRTKSQRQSIVHHYAYPYPGHYHGDQSAGFRNPGGNGRYLEYYPPGNDFQSDQGRDRVKVARFDTGGGAPDRAQQMEAQQIGVQRSNAIQNHIDSYARPYVGYGVGYFGGFY